MADGIGAYDVMLLYLLHTWLGPCGSGVFFDPIPRAQHGACLSPVRTRTRSCTCSAAYVIWSMLHARSTCSNTIVRFTTIHDKQSNYIVFQLLFIGYYLLRVLNSLNKLIFSIYTWWLPLILSYSTSRDVIFDFRLLNFWLHRFSWFYFSNKVNYICWIQCFINILNNVFNFCVHGPLFKFGQWLLDANN